MESYSSEIDSIATIVIDDFLLQKFLRNFSYFSIPPRPNTVTRFHLIDTSQSPFANSPSSLKPSAWAELLSGYPGFLRVYLSMIICFGVQLGYKGPIDTLILSNNLFSALVDIEIIDEKLRDDLEFQQVVEVSLERLFICSPLGLVPKHDGCGRKIHHLSHPVSRSVNNHIPDGVGELRYLRF